MKSEASSKTRQGCACLLLRTSSPLLRYESRPHPGTRLLCQPPSRHHMQMLSTIRVSFSFA